MLDTRHISSKKDKNHRKYTHGDESTANDDDNGNGRNKVKLDGEGASPN